MPISGKRAVVLGRSNIVGMPVAHLLQACFLLPHRLSEMLPRKVLHGKIAQRYSVCPFHVHVLA